MIARLEIVSAVVRVYDDTAPPPAPFVAAVAVVADETRATVKALSGGDLPLPVFAAIRTALRDAGFQTAEWHRRDPSTGEHRVFTAAIGTTGRENVA